ncbi:septum formation inhibitor Maf [Enemella evansiae]|uniref:Maf family protein n=1 Tax=Enemella evansiae TaxID=2016499 RepID=UPI000B97A09C|nr:nucleoside triphosphate pyrophosphatase [Enemella evansiae]OYN98589.1 septum formation inhibitor Maf [Enemella evansiae]
MRLILASASPARLQTLRSAGLAPEVIVSGVDEEALGGPPPAELAQVLADAKAEAVAARLDDEGAGASADWLLVGCDSVLELDGAAHGKPGTPEIATQRWQAMRGRCGVLHTGHRVIRRAGDRVLSAGRTGSTEVHFADLSDAEIAAYVASGEPLEVAGAFTIDGLGGAYVRSIVGDPHNVVGISLPLLRDLTAEVAVPWHTLWSATSAG